MRDILFRGKTNEGRWLFGDLIHSSSGILIRSEDFLEGAPVVEKTVGQFTGIVDTNRVQIFEGDVLEHERELWLVLFKTGSFRLVRISSVSPFGGIKDISDVLPYQRWLVVGNIFDDDKFISEFDEMCKRECDRLRNKERLANIRRRIFS